MNKKITKSAVIVGMGPAGWLQALELIKSGITDITMIDKRENPYQRFNRVALTYKTLKFIFENHTSFTQNGFSLHYIPPFKGKYNIYLQRKNPVSKAEINSLDLAFFRTVKDNGCTITIPELQEYLRNKAFEAAATKGCKINETHGEVVKIDTISVQPAVIMNDDVSIPFQNLIIASGNSKFMPKTERKTLPLPKTANMTNFAIQLRLDLGSANEKIKQRTLKDILQRAQVDPFSIGLEKAAKQHLPLLKNLGWSRKNLPTKFIDFNAKTQTFYIAGECPDHIASLPDTQKVAALESWAKTLLLIEYPELDLSYANLGRIINNINLNTSDKASATTFLTEPSYIKNPFKSLPNKQCIFYVGDVLFKPNYRFGHGIDFARRAASAIANCFKDGEFVSAKEYKQVLPQLEHDFLRMNRIFNIVSMLKKADVYDNFLHMTDKFFSTKTMLFNHMPSAPTPRTVRSSRTSKLTRRP